MVGPTGDLGRGRRASHPRIRTLVCVGAPSAFRGAAQHPPSMNTARAFHAQSHTHCPTSARTCGSSATYATAGAEVDSAHHGGSSHHRQGRLPDGNGPGSVPRNLQVHGGGRGHPSHVGQAHAAQQQVTGVYHDADNPGQVTPQRSAPGWAPTLNMGFPSYSRDMRTPLELAGTVADSTEPVNAVLVALRRRAESSAPEGVEDTCRAAVAADADGDDTCTTGQECSGPSH
jgi:hypothetical protein